MKKIILLLAFSSHTFAQFNHIEMTQTACQSSHCYSSPAISKDGDVFYIDTLNGIDAEHGTALMTFVNDVPSSMIVNQNEFISHVKTDSNGQPVVKIGDQLVRYPNKAINAALQFVNNGPTANSIDWDGDVAYLAYYPSISTCDDDSSVAYQIVSSNIQTHPSLFKSIMSNQKILADSCTDVPEAFVASGFVRTSDNVKFNLYTIFVNSSPNTISRMYLHMENGNDRIIADGVITAEVNDYGLAVWATETNNHISIYQQDMNDLSTPPVLLEQIIIPIGLSYNINDLSLNNSGDIVYLLQSYEFNTQTFSYQLNVKKFSSNSFQNMLLTGAPLNNKVISEIRWSHHGIDDFGVIVSSIKFTDDSEAIIKSLTREPQNIGFDVSNVVPDSQGVYNIGRISIHEAYKQPTIISEVPIHQDYQVLSTFFRQEDEYFEQGSSNFAAGKLTTLAFSATPPELNLEPITTYHQIIQTTPNIAIQPQTVSLIYLEPTQVCNGICVRTCIFNTDQNLTGDNKGSNSLTTTYERLVTEQLESTPAGNYYLSMYFQNFIAIRDVVFSEPLSLWKFKTLFESWQPAVDDLLDGDGSYEITIEMSESLNNTLNLIERVSNPQLKTFINNSRNNMNLYALPGITIGSFMANEFEDSFADLIFIGDFE